MPKKTLCTYCGQEITSNTPSKKFQGNNYHLSCYIDYTTQKYNLSECQTKQKQELYNYVCGMFGLTELTPFLNNQLQKIFKENQFTYEGVLYSLKYFFEIKNNTPDIKTGVGIVPYVYEEAKAFYTKKQTISDKIAKEGIAPHTVVTVKLKSAPPIKQNNLIDLNKL